MRSANLNDLSDMLRLPWNSWGLEVVGLVFVWHQYRHKTDMCPRPDTLHLMCYRFILLIGAGDFLCTH